MVMDVLPPTLTVRACRACRRPPGGPAAAEVARSPGQGGDEAEDDRPRAGGDEIRQAGDSAGELSTAVGPSSSTTASATAS